MTNDQAPFEFQAGMSIDVPATRRCLPVLETDWEHLKARIDQISVGTRWPEWLASAVLAVSVQAGVDAYTNYTDVKMTITIAAAIMTVIMLFMSRHTRRQVASSKEYVLQEMRRAEDSWCPPVKGRRVMPASQDLPAPRRISSSVLRRVPRVGRHPHDTGH